MFSQHTQWACMCKCGILNDSYAAPGSDQQPPSIMPWGRLPSTNLMRAALAKKQRSYPEKQALWLWMCAQECTHVIYLRGSEFSDSIPLLLPFTVFNRLTDCCLSLSLYLMHSVNLVLYLNSIVSWHHGNWCVTWQRGPDTCVTDQWQPSSPDRQTLWRTGSGMTCRQHCGPWAVWQACWNQIKPFACPHCWSPLSSQVTYGTTLRSILHCTLFHFTLSKCCKMQHVVHRITAALIWRWACEWV